MVKFDGIDQLVAQLKEDEAVSRNWTKRGGTEVLASQLFWIVGKTQWLSVLYTLISSALQPSQLCGGGTTKSNSTNYRFRPTLFFGLLLGENERGFFFPLKFRKIVEKSKSAFQAPIFLYNRVR